MKKLIKAFKNLFIIKDDPGLIAKGFALGSFIGMMPIPGFQIMVSLAIATLLNFNKRAAVIAVFNTNLATGVFVFSFNYFLGRKILGINSPFEIGEKIDIQFVSHVISAGYDVFLSLVVGGVITGALTAIIAYYGLKRLLTPRLKKRFE
jgi:uncharacterized protein